MKLFLAILLLASGNGFSAPILGDGDGEKEEAVFVDNFLNVTAQEYEFDPLRDILLEEPSDGLNYYIGKRCVAVGFVSVKLFEESPEFEEENQKVRSKTIELIHAIINDWAPASGFEVTFEEFMGEVGPIIESYKQEVRVSFEETGNPRSDFLLNQY